MTKLLSFYWILLLQGTPDHFQQESNDVHAIYVSSISWHTGIIIPAYALPDSLWHEGHNYSNAPYLEIGWGDKDFFTHPGFNLWYAFKAVFWPTSSAIHINPIHRKVEGFYYNTDVVKIELNDDQLYQLCLYLVGEFKLDKNQKVIPVAEGFYQGSHFYKGSSSYYFPNNSNVWVARAVKRAGFPIRPIWHQTTGSVLKKVAEFGELVVEGE
jgi:uncharacterized protein (TIGR02117 family)